jgi:predicted phage tail protein
MNSSPDDLDATVLAHFRQDDAAIAHDPFVAVTAQRIRAARRRRKILRQALQGGGVAALVLGSRWLIAAAALVSTKLDAWFATGFAWLLTPLGTVIVAAGILAAVATGLGLRRRRS